MFEIFRIPKKIWKLMTSCWENWDFSKIPVPLCSIIFINILSQFFWSSGQRSELQIQSSWVQSPPGENFFLKFFLCVFCTKISIFYVLIHRKRYKWTLFYFLKVYNIVRLVLVQKWHFPFLSWMSLISKTETCQTSVFQSTFQKCRPISWSIFLGYFYKSSIL